jgi:hypothetical protein
MHPSQTSFCVKIYYTPLCVMSDLWLWILKIILFFFIFVPSFPLRISNAVCTIVRIVFYQNQNTWKYRTNFISNVSSSKSMLFSCLYRLFWGFVLWNSDWICHYHPSPFLLRNIQLVGKLNMHVSKNPWNLKQLFKFSVFEFICFQVLQFLL